MESSVGVETAGLTAVLSKMMTNIVWAAQVGRHTYTCYCGLWSQGGSTE